MARLDPGHASLCPVLPADADGLAGVAAGAPAGLTPAAAPESDVMANGLLVAIGMISFGGHTFMSSTLTINLLKKSKIMMNWLKDAVPLSAGLL